MTPVGIARALQSEIISIANQPDQADYNSLAYDSRKAASGGIFVCLSGAQSDGHDYIDSALEKGISCLVVEKKQAFERYGTFAFVVLVKNTRKALALLSAAFFGNPAQGLHLIGLTGTKGKTSTSYMIRQILLEHGISCGLVGTTGIFYGDQSEYIDNSTPESYELHRIFADMIQNGVTHVVMEVSSQALMTYRVLGLTFDIAVFTNISPDHIGPNEHKDFEEYLYYKSTLFRHCRFAVVNLDDSHADVILSVLKQNAVPYETYSCHPETQANHTATDPCFELGDSLSTCFTLDGTQRLHVNVPGKFSVYNALCAATVGLALDCSVDCIRIALEKVTVIGRTELCRHPKCPFPILIDYAHNAVSLESLFDAVKAYHPNRILCVFGCGGNRSKLRRYDMGEISGRHADLSVITSDNPRFEKLDDIIEDILTGIHKTNGSYIVVKDRKQAIFYALAHAEKGDIVLLAGKGQQDYEEIEGVHYPFDERKVVQEYFDTQV